MSYILDALKKSEQERGNGNIPGVQTIHSSSLNYANKKVYWPYFLIAAVSLNLIAVLYFVFDKENKAPAINVTTAGENTVKENIDTQAISNNAAQIENKLITNTVTADSHTAQQHTQTRLPPTNMAKQKRLTTAEAINTPLDIPHKQAIAAPKIAHSSDKNIIDFYDLPASVKRELPSIIISSHVYSSNPLLRSIVINNNFKEEGEYVLDDLILYEITRDGAVFAYHDILFHYGVVSTWQ